MLTFRYFWFIELISRTFSSKLFSSSAKIVKYIGYYHAVEQRQDNFLVSLFFFTRSSRHVAACRRALRRRLADSRHFTARVSRLAPRLYRVWLYCSVSFFQDASRSPPASRPVSQRPGMSRTGVCSDLGAPHHLRVCRGGHILTGAAAVFHCEPVVITHPPLVTSIIPNNARFSSIESVFWLCLRVLPLSCSQS